MARTDWLADPGIKQIDVRKLSVLMALMNESEGKSFAEMIPFILEANQNLSAMGLSFSENELHLIFDILKADMSENERTQFNKLKSLMNLPNWT